MNVLESVTIRSPNEIEEECAHFTITDTEQPFVLNDIAKPDEQYTFSAWVKGSGEISIARNKFPVTADWTKCVITFNSDSADVEIYFRENGDYYFYNSQLEIGEKDTDYSPAPEDLESRVTDAETVIRVQAGLIEQKVSANGVISAINQSAEEIKISASKITLEGETIADAFTCTNLTVAGDSTFSGVLNGATGNFSGVVNATDFKLTKSGNDFKFAINTDGSQLYLGTDTVEDFTVASLILPGGQDNAVLYGFYGAEMKTGRGSIKLTTGDLGSIILTAGENVEINSHLIMDTASANSLSAGIIEPTYLKWYPSSNTNFDEVQLRLAGSTGSQGISFVTVKDGTTSVFGNIFDANNRFMPDFPVSIYSINTYGFASGSAVANGSTNTKTTTIPAIPSGYTYALLVGRSSYCCMSDYSVSGTTLSVTMINISGASHTLTLYVTLIVFKNRW